MISLNVQIALIAFALWIGLIIVACSCQNCLDRIMVGIMPRWIKNKDKMKPMNDANNETKSQTDMENTDDGCHIITSTEQLEPLPTPPSHCQEYDSKILAALSSQKQSMSEDEIKRTTLAIKAEWREKIKSYLDKMTEKRYGVKGVLTDLVTLFEYHKAQQLELEEDLARAIFTKAMEDPDHSQLYVQIGYYCDADNDRFFRHLVRLFVEEFNSPLPVIDADGQAKRKKLNNVGLMVEILKYYTSEYELLENWIARISNCLATRVDADQDHSAEQLCHFWQSLSFGDIISRHRWFLPNTNKVTNPSDSADHNVQKLDLLDEMAVTKQLAFERAGSI